MGKAKINAQIQSIQKNKMNMFQNLGELVYNLHINGVISIEQCAGMCNEITSYNDTIEELQKLAEEIEMKKNAPVYETVAGADAVCPICASVNPAGSKFCAICGAEIPAAVAETLAPSAQGVVCANCGAVNEESSKFCANCGFGLAVVPVAEPVVVEEVVEEPQSTSSSIFTSEPKPEVAEMICSNCETINEPTARFCAGCGYDMIAGKTNAEVFYTSKDDTPEGSVCPNCLTNNEVGARFCATCGTQLV